MALRLAGSEFYVRWCTAVRGAVAVGRWSMGASAATATIYVPGMVFKHRFLNSLLAGLLDPSLCLACGVFAPERPLQTHIVCCCPSPCCFLLLLLLLLSVRWDSLLRRRRSMTLTIDHIFIFSMCRLRRVSRSRQTRVERPSYTKPLPASL